MNGYGLAQAAGSVVLVSAAQLAMRWSMTRLPRIEALPLPADSFALLPLGLLSLGIALYAASFLCWLRALAHLPLGRAYSLLSLSYPLVYLLSAVLPGLDASPSIAKSCGVILVVAGVMLVNARRGPAVHATGQPAN